MADPTTEDTSPVKEITLRTKEVTDPFGNKVVLHYKQATKRMRDRAIIAAAHDYKGITGEVGGISFGVFDREMVLQMVAKWEGLPMPVKPNWDLISPEMGDSIVKGLAIRDLMKGAVEGAGVDAAKNSSAPSSEGDVSGQKE